MFDFIPPSFITLLVHLVFPFFVTLAAVFDMLTFRIPNWLNIILAVTFFIMIIIVGVTLDAFLLSVMSGFIVLIVGFILFAYNLLGAGDVKLASVCALWLGLENILIFALFFSLIGGALTLFILLVRKVHFPPIMLAFKPLDRLVHNNKIPYGVAISAAAFLVYYGYIGFSGSYFFNYL